MPRSFEIIVAAASAAVFFAPSAFAAGIQEHIPEEECAQAGEVPLERVFEYAVRAHDVHVWHSQHTQMARFADDVLRLLPPDDSTTLPVYQGEDLARWNLIDSARELFEGRDTPVHGRTHVIIDRTAPAGLRDRLHSFFSLQATWLHVVCGAPETPQTPADTQRRRPNPLVAYLGAIQIGRDLKGAQGDDISDRNFATLSGRDDRETGEQTASFEGLALFPIISRPFGNAELRPYVGYHRTHSSASDEEINDLNFGGLFSFSLQGDSDGPAILPDTHYFDASFDWETDDEFKSSVTTAELFYNPMWGGNFGNERRIPNCLGAACSWDFTLVADFAEVGDPGDKAALLDLDQYGRIGANLELGYYLLTPVGTISLAADYRIRDAFTDDGGDADRLVAELALTPSDTGRFKIALEYVTGEDLTSFEVEDYTALAIGFRN